MNYAIRWSQAQKEPQNWFFLETIFVCGEHIKTKIKFSTDLFELLPKPKENKKRKEIRLVQTMCVTLREKEEAKSSSLTFPFRRFTRSKNIMQYGSIFDYARGNIHEFPLNVFIIHVNVSRTNVKYSNMSRIRLSPIAKVNISHNGVVTC